MPGLSEIADGKLKAQVLEASLPLKKVEKNITIHDTRKGTNLGFCPNLFK